MALPSTDPPSFKIQIVEHGHRARRRPPELVRAAEATASRFFVRPQGEEDEEEEEAPTLGYGSKRVGNIGCVEDLLLASHTSALCCRRRFVNANPFTRDNGNNHRLQ